MGTLKSNVTRFLGGVTSVVAQNKVMRFAVTGTWLTDDLFTLLFPYSDNGEVINLGAGDATNQQPTFGLTHQKKSNLLSSERWLFSALGAPTTFNLLPATGNSNIDLTDYFSTSTDTKALSTYQGGLAVFSDDCIFIWKDAADPDAYVNIQIIPNLGTQAKLSAVASGESDVYFLHETGIRSLRARDSSNQVLVSDIGSAVDLLIQNKIRTATEEELANACGVIEPVTGQYWLFLKDTLYVVSNFPSAKIIAWATWDCSYQATAGIGVTIRNGDGTSYLFKSNIVDDVSTATSHGVLAFLGTTAVLSPIKYIWVYDSTGTTLIEQMTVPNGLAFSGEIYYVPSSTLFAAKQTAFTPQKFEVYQRQVFVSTSEGFYAYGGADKQTYDNVVGVAETSWLDADSPANQKTFHGVDVAQSGTWNHYTGTRFSSGLLQHVLSSATNPTFDGGKISYSSYGTHIKHRMQTTGLAERCVMSNLLLHFTQSNQK